MLSLSPEQMRWRWLALGVVATAFILSFFQRFAPAGIAQDLAASFGTTAASLGHIGMAEAELGNWKEAETLLASSLEQFDRLGVGKNAEGIAAFREKLNECRNMLAKEPTDE